MKALTRDEFKAKIIEAHVKKRLQRDLRFVPEEISDWGERNFMAITVKSGREGVLISDDIVLPFTMTARTAGRNGRIEAIICDIGADHVYQRSQNHRDASGMR